MNMNRLAVIASTPTPLQGLPGIAAQHSSPEGGTHCTTWHHVAGACASNCETQPQHSTAQPSAAQDGQALTVTRAVGTASDWSPETAWHGSGGTD